MTGSYDPEFDLIYWGVGNPAADFYGEGRQGSNLYTDCIVALKATSGEVAWYFQEIPHDLWDYDSAYECILLDLPVNGKMRKLLLHPNKGGYIYIVDRTNGEFITGWKFMDNLNWSTGLDAKGVPQGRREPVIGTPMFLCPSIAGASDELCDRAKLETLAASLPGAWVRVVESDHFFTGALGDLATACRAAIAWLGPSGHATASP